MIVNTKHGDFECKDITRKKRRSLYRKVKEVFAALEQTKVHDLADEFALIAFVTEEKAEERLKGLSALAEDEVLMEIINSYMGFNSGNITGD